MLQIQETIKNNRVLTKLKDQLPKDVPNYPSFETYRLFFETGDRTVFEDIYFQRRKKLTQLGLLCVHSPSKENVRELENMLFSVCQEFTWSLPAHVKSEREENESKREYTLDLFACETAFTLAELLTLLDAHLSLSIKQIVKAALLERVIEPFLQNSWEWETLDNNWSSVCAGSVGVTALYIIKKDEPTLSAILTRVEKAMACYLSGFGEDGACVEGLSYWQYGFRYFTYFADASLTFPGGSKNLFADAKVKKIAQFQQKMTFYDKTVINYSDSSPTLEPAYDLAHYYHNLFPEDVSLPEGTYEESKLMDHCGRWAPALRTLSWVNEAISPADSDEFRTVDWLDDAQIFVLNTEAMSFSAKGGHNEESHNHIDLGHFILHYHQVPCFIDLGAPVYTKDYFSQARYKTLHASAKGHSIPVINGVEQAAGKDAVARIKYVSTEVPALVLDLSHAYKESDLSHYERRFTVEEKLNRLNVTDSFSFDKKENSVLLRYILASVDSISERESGATLLKDGLIVDLDFSTKPLSCTYSPITYIDHDSIKQEATVLEIELHTLDKDFDFTLSVSCQKTKENSDD